MYKDTWRELWEEHNMSEYLLHDVLGNLEVCLLYNSAMMEAFQISIYQGRTAASLAKKTFYWNYYGKRVKCGKRSFKVFDKNSKEQLHYLSEEMDEFVRKSYLGGRCEAFIIGKKQEPIFYDDFTSMYPDACRS